MPLTKGAKSSAPNPQISVAVLLATVLLPGVLSGCSTREAARARSVAANHMLCPASELEAGVYRETESVREWYVGCNFTYTRVQCTDNRCVHAEPKPPCSDDMPCFEENPVTLKWEMRERAAVAERQ